MAHNPQVVVTNTYDTYGKTLVKLHLIHSHGASSLPLVVASFSEVDRHRYAEAWCRFVALVLFI